MQAGNPVGALHLLKHFEKAELGTTNCTHCKKKKKSYLKLIKGQVNVLKKIFLQWSESFQLFCHLQLSDPSACLCQPDLPVCCPLHCSKYLCKASNPPVPILFFPCHYGKRHHHDCHLAIASLHPTSICFSMKFLGLFLLDICIQHCEGKINCWQNARNSLKNKITLPELNEIWLVYKRAMSPDIWPFEELTM